MAFSCDIYPADGAIEIGSFWLSPRIQKTRASVIRSNSQKHRSTLYIRLDTELQRHRTDDLLGDDSGWHLISLHALPISVQARFLNTNQSISSVTTSAGLMLAR
jgi:hypothetical protein